MILRHPGPVILDGECHVCGLRRAMMRDHDHASGLIRGLLCGQCNVLAQEPDLLERVLAYIGASAIGPEYRRDRLTRRTGLKNEEERRQRAAREATRRAARDADPVARAEYLRYQREYSASRRRR